MLCAIGPPRQWDQPQVRARSSTTSSPSQGLMPLRSFPEPLAMSFLPGASPPGGIHDDHGVSQTLSFSLTRLSRRTLSADLLVECLGDRTQPGSAQSFHLASSGPCQRRRQRQVDQQHYTCHRVKPSCADHVAVVGPPVQLQAGVDPFHCGTAVVQPLELLGRRGIGGNRRRSSSLLIRATTP